MTKSSSQSGVALLIVMMALAFMMIFCLEISYSTLVDIKIARNERDRLQAHYLAKSAAKLSVLRLYLYSAALKQFDSQLKNSSDPANASYQDLVNKIWSQDVPPLPLEMTDNGWPGRIYSSIQAEGSKIPINLLDANIHRKSSIAISKTVYAQLKNLVDSYYKDEKFLANYENVKPDEFVAALKDWVSSGSEGDPLGGGGDKNTLYDRLSPSYRARSDRIPTLTELHLIRGWTDDFIKRILSSLSLVNDRVGLNPNFISLDRLKAFDPNLENEDLKNLELRRAEKPFTSLQDLENYIRTELKSGQNFTFNLADKSTGIVENLREHAFLIKATGILGETQRNLELSVLLPEEYVPPNPAHDPNSTGQTPSPAPPSQNSGTSTTPPTTLPNLKEPVILRIEENL